MTYGGRRHRKTDANCGAIVAILRGLGFKVHVTNDVYDLVAQLNGRTVLCEVRPEGQARTPRPGPQAQFHAEFSVHWLQSADDCRALRRELLGVAPAARQS